MDSHQLHDFVVSARQIVPLTMRQLHFLVGWYESNNDSFGFRDIKDPKEQMKTAIELFLATEREWQETIISTNEPVNFFDFFIAMANVEGIELVEDFEDKITKGELHGFFGNQEVGK